MLVEKTSNKREAAKSLPTLPRESIVELRAGKRRVRGRVIGTIAGFYAFTGIGAAATGSAEALQSGWGLAAVAGGVIGYFVGRSFDHATQQIVILP